MSASEEAQRLGKYVVLDTGAESKASELPYTALKNLGNKHNRSTTMQRFDIRPIKACNMHEVKSLVFLRNRFGRPRFL
jgi:hypothetical protein